MKKLNKLQKLTENPYYFNIGIILLIIVFFIIIHYGINSYLACIYGELLKNIIFGIVSSSILLLILEFILCFKDKKLYGRLKGRYKRTFIAVDLEKIDLGFEVNSFRNLSKRETYFIKKRNLKHLSNSRYAEEMGYRVFDPSWEIELKYRYHGIYYGRASYHKYWGNYGEEAIVDFTLILNRDNPTHGSGNYKYKEIDDFGTYDFQVSSETNEIELFIFYSNIIPSGLAAGYEKWKKKE